MTTPSLTEFLLARIAEDEAVATKFRDCEWSGADAWGDGGTDLFFGQDAPASVERVLAECAAKRAAVEKFGPEVDGGDGFAAGAEWALMFMALPYSYHPDYRQEWKP